MKKKRIFILLGHPDEGSLNCFLSKHYEEGSRYSGFEVRRMNLHDMEFDPILHHGYRIVQELEPDLARFQENIKWCNHFVLFYPVWHGGPPALLKGVFDRAWLPGFAFVFKENGLGWKKLLKGKSARVFVTTGSIPIISRVMFGDYTNEIKKNLLGFAGFKPVRLKTLGPAEKISKKKAERWAGKVYQMGRKGY